MSGFNNTLAGLALAASVGAAQAEEPKVSPAGAEGVAVTTQAATQRLMVAVDSIVVAQAIVPNPEYDRIIADAQKKGIDVLEYVNANKKDWGWTLKDYMNFSKYNRGLADQASITRRAQEADLNRANAEASRQLNIATVKLVNGYADARKTGKFKNSDLDYLKKIYNHEATSDEVRKLIQDKFGDLFDFRTLAAQA